MDTQESVMPAVYPNGQIESANKTALFSQDPERAYKEAQRLVSVVANRCTGPGYLVNIKGKQYPKIEWWTSVSASLGLFPRVLYSKRLDREDEIAYEAKVEVYRNGNQIVASGEAMCSNRESRWQGADEYAIKSMAITRASGKAYRIPLSFLAVMAGLEVTPAEEMPTETTSYRQSDRDIMANQRGNDSRATPQRPQNQDEGIAATERQVTAVRGLIDNPKVYPNEKRQIHELLADGLSKVKAKELLDFYYGVSILVDGEWTKMGNGQLAQRS
jgi:hypothetical protein